MGQGCGAVGVWPAALLAVRAEGAQRNARLAPRQLQRPRGAEAAEALGPAVATAGQRVHWVAGGAEGQAGQRAPVHALLRLGEGGGRTGGRLVRVPEPTLRLRPAARQVAVTPAHLTLYLRAEA